MKKWKDFKWKVVELPTQKLFLTIYGTVDVDIVTLQDKAKKHDVIVSLRTTETLLEAEQRIHSDWSIDKWYFNKKDKKYYVGVGSANTRRI